MCSPIKLVCFLPVFLVLLQVHCNDDRAFSTAPSCLKYECPRYTVAYTDLNNNYEIRIYNTSLWVSSPKIQPSDNISSPHRYRTAANQGFRILYSYYNGSNTKGVKINMTAPVFVDIQNEDYIVYFYVPQKYQCGSGTSLPQPKSTNITNVMLPKDTTAYALVRRYDGYTNDSTIANELHAFKTSLNGSSWYKYLNASTPNNITVAGYNNPYEKSNRVNELIVFFNKY